MARGSIARLEIYTGLACEPGSAMVGVLPDWRNARTEDYFEGIVALSRFLVEIPQLSAYAAQVVAGRVLRVVYTEAAIPFDEYRIGALTDASDDGMLQIEGADILLDLAEQSELLTETVSGRVSFAPAVTPDTVANFLTTWVLGFAPSFWDLGTITPTATVAPAVAEARPLAAAIAAVDEANLAEGASYEISRRRNGTTGYYLDVTVKGSGDPTAYLRDSLNLIRLRRRRDPRDQRTRGQPVGIDGRGLGDAWFRVASSVANTYLAIEDINGSALNMILEDDQFNTSFYLAIEDVVTKYQITDTDRANRRLHMNPTPASPNGKWVRICRNSAGDELKYLDYPTKQAAYGVKLGPPLKPRFAGRTNWFKNPDGRNGTTNFPTDWTSGNATKITTAGLWRYGGASWRITDAGAAGALSQSRTFYLPAGVWTMSFWGRLSASANQFQIVMTVGATAVTIPLNGRPGDEAFRIDETFVVAAGSAAVSIALNCAAAGAGALLYADAIQFVQGEPTTDPILGSGGASNWLTAVASLQDDAEPVTSYEMTLADLRRLDPDQFANAALNHGATMQVDQSDLSVHEAVRIVRLLTDHDNPADSQVTLANRRPELTQLLAGAL